jgi:hypothetical protein
MMDLEDFSKSGSLAQSKSFLTQMAKKIKIKMKLSYLFSEIDNETKMS